MVFVSQFYLNADQLHFFLKLAGFSVIICFDWFTFSNVSKASKVLGLNLRFDVFDVFD